jgi:succinate dehydrogenase / fumarate reductase flavoprotein subunit/L-aspartate oxidase
MDDMENLKRLAESTREERRAQTIPILSSSDKDRLIQAFHPDYKTESYRNLRVGINAGDKTVHELADLLEGDSMLDEKNISFKPDYTVDVLVVGGGGAGCAAALTAHQEGADVLLATKLRLGDSNTVMAQGGIQVAIGEDDSPINHFVDTMKGGHHKNDPGLLKTMVENGPAIADWLLSLGVVFDRDESGNLKVRRGGGSSKPRLLTCSDYTGLEIIRVLKDEVLNRGIRVQEFAPAVELLSDEKGGCSGAILKDLDNQRYLTVSAKNVVLATGGIGRLHIQGFPTSNHYGATADALPLSYRMGAKLIYIDTFQYHPTGVIFPEQLAGALITEGLRSDGAHLVNRDGKRFVNELDTRDVVSSAIIRECKEGRGVMTSAGREGVWIDIPVVDMINGAGTIEKRFPAMLKQFERYNIDIRVEPVLTYPTLHYQNGGVQIDVNAESTVKNLFVAGEASGGLHGRNRLMGNSLLDIMVFGQRAGKTTALRSRMMTHGKLTLNHLKKFRSEFKKAGIKPKVQSPMVLPHYVRREAAHPASV